MNFIITGSNGKMGQSLIKLLTLSGNNIIELNRKTNLVDLKAKGKSIVIDFSSPDYFNKIIDWSVENNIPVVSGTTGLSEQQFEKIKILSSKIPILWAPNMSLGVAFLNKLVAQFSDLSKEFDFQIEEFHHKHKVDSPSGTGFLLQETLKTAVDKNVPDVLSIRGGGIYGVHKVWAMSDDETICLEHQALNRDVFANGAIKCAKWLIDKKPGSYTIKDIINS